MTDISIITVTLTVREAEAVNEALLMAAGARSARDTDAARAKLLAAYIAAYNPLPDSPVNTRTRPSASRRELATALMAADMSPGVRTGMGADRRAWCAPSDRLPVVAAEGALACCPSRTAPGALDRRGARPQTVILGPMVGLDDDGELATLATEAIESGFADTTEYVEYLASIVDITPLEIIS